MGDRARQPARLPVAAPASTQASSNATSANARFLGPSTKVGRIDFVDNAKYASEAIDQKVITAPALDVVQQGFAYPLQQVAPTRLEPGVPPLAGLEYNE